MAVKICNTCGGSGCLNCMYRGHTIISSPPFPPPPNNNGNQSGCLKNLAYGAFGFAALVIAGALFGENDEDVTTPTKKKISPQEIHIKKTPPSVIKENNERMYTVPSNASRLSTKRKESIRFRTDKDEITTPRQEKEKKYPTYKGYPVILESAIKDYTGRAICKYNNGYIFKGEFKNGYWHGEGTLHYTNGDVYEGEWKNGQRHGEGKFTHADGDFYDGNWKNNLEHGRGILSQDRIVIQGRWSKGKLKREFNPKSNAPQP